MYLRPEILLEEDALRGILRNWNGGKKDEEEIVISRRPHLEELANLPYRVRPFVIQKINRYVYEKNVFHACICGTYACIVR